MESLGAEEIERSKDGKNRKYKLIGGESIGCFVARSGDWLFKSHSVGSVMNSISLYRDQTGTSFIEAVSRLEEIHRIASIARNDGATFGGETAAKARREEVIEYFKKGACSVDRCDFETVLNKRGLSDVRRRRLENIRALGRDGDIKALYFHFDEDGKLEPASVETIRVDGKKGYMKSGSVGCWLSQPDDIESCEVVICESVIDALSFEAMNPHSDKMLVALRSGAEEIAAKIAIKAAENGAKRITIATDNDPAGLEYAAKVFAKIEEAIRKKEIERIDVAMQLPPGRANDWNDALVSEHIDLAHARPQIAAE